MFLSCSGYNKSCPRAPYQRLISGTTIILEALFHDVRLKLQATSSLDRRSLFTNLAGLHFGGPWSSGHIYNYSSLTSGGPELY